MSDHILPKRTYYTIYAILLVCTYLTWQVAFFDLGALNTVAALAIAGPDEGARALLKQRPELVDEIEVAGDPTDLDTPEDLRRYAAG